MQGRRHKPAPRKAAMVVGRLESVNDEKLRLFHDNLGAHVMARQVADVGEHAGDLRRKPQLGLPLGGNKTRTKPVPVNSGAVIPPNWTVGFCKRNKGKKACRSSSSFRMTNANCFP